MNALGTASVAALRQYVRYADAKGIAVDPLFEKAGLKPEILDSDEGRIDGEQLQVFIRLLAEHTGNPVLGLETGDYVQPGSYSVLGYITMSCATLGEAVTRIAPYEKLVGDMGTTRLKMKGDSATLIWTCNFTDSVVWPQVVDNVFASWINYARWLADSTDATPLEVRLRRPSPGPEHEKAYALRWQCPVQFDAEEDSVTFAQTLLATRLRQPDPLLRKTLEAHALSQLALLDTDTDLTSKVKQSIQKQLAEGITRQDMVAEDLGMTSRTLQRKLSQEGVSYQKLLDEVRQQMAEDYLQNTDMSIPDIALRLGYSETTSFHRKFKAATGKTPGDFRRQ
ncbi:AraC family transcriptional regulator [Marinobacter nauticus]|uniref:AraC family transcriptional regulator n=1 Tax=Marinobacter nauticus TaxID=2743 RepID=UPI001C99D05B|nr:AraC family transcriptional regulator [Marinobacter nauticus]MBY5937604.1 AraC family transcriptional regulator [Marinobacter nauticus]MBY5954832.1 AraC family transcriptional regulator [Marinobacter nauticus]MBY6008625.1 AraC family transcriptional regulator [Marinobacter nauticus]